MQSWSTTASVISGISNYLTTPEQLTMLKQFTNEKGHLFGTSVKTLENSITSTEVNLKWAGAHLGKLFNYLSQRHNSAATTSAALFLIPLSLITLQMFM